MSFPTNILKNISIRELAWCIGAPGLMNKFDKLSSVNFPSKDFFEALKEESMVWLTELDDNPDAVTMVLGTEQKQILGKRFEKLLHLFFEKSPRYTLMHHGVQLMEGDLTIGELDFVVRDHFENKTLHIETACKFYLSADNQADLHAWPGINPKDTLYQKCEKLKTQIKLTETPVGRDWCKKNNLRIDEKQIWLKGYFFHHYRDIGRQKSPNNAGKFYPAGWWMRQSEAADFFRRSKGIWVILPKESWLSPAFFHEKDPQLLNSERLAMLLHTWPDHHTKSLMVAMLLPDSDSEMLFEVNRGVVVPNRWPGNY